MNKLNILLICFIFTNCFGVDAQYRISKEKYSSSNYVYKPGDRYNPTDAAAASVAIPGLGQMICGEGRRGACILLGCTGSLAVFFVGIFKSSNVRKTGSIMEPDINPGYTIMALSGMASNIVIYIWSIGDASRVAKVNNMALRDKEKVSSSVRIQPYIDFQSYSANNKTTPGLTVKINF